MLIRLNYDERRLLYLAVSRMISDFQAEQCNEDKTYMRVMSVNEDIYRRLLEKIY